MRGLVVVASALLAASCGVGLGASDPGPGGSPATVATSPASSARGTSIYLTTSRGLWTVWRQRVPASDVQTSLDLLLEGPTGAERSRGITTAIPPDFGSLTATARTGRVDVALPSTFSRIDSQAILQIACTVAASPGVPGNVAPDQVVVDMHEPGDTQGAQMRCNDTGDVTMVDRPSDTSGGSQ